jgi:uncharacterized protein (DUF58 family)
MADDAKRYFDPQVIARLKGLEVRARRVVEGHMLGLHKSPFRGISVEFAEYRQYTPGDDLRRIDWKAYAKTDRYFIKIQEQETNLACQFVLDCSESMTYQGAGAMSKYDYAATMVSSAAYLLLNQQDRVGLTLFDSDVRAGMPPKSTGSHYRAMVAAMEAATPGAATMVGGALTKVGMQLKGRGIVVIVSDFLDDIEPLTYGLNRLSFDGHDIIVLHVSDPWERDFPFTGPSIINGMENSGKLTCDPGDLRRAYMDARAEHLEELRLSCRRLQFDMCECSTDEPLDEVLSRVLSNRARVTHR